MCSKNFCVQAKGGIAQCPPPPNTPMVGPCVGKMGWVELIVSVSCWVQFGYLGWVQKKLLMSICGLQFCSS